MRKLFWYNVDKPSQPQCSVISQRIAILKVSCSKICVESMIYALLQNKNRLYLIRSQEQELACRIIIMEKADGETCVNEYNISRPK